MKLGWKILIMVVLLVSLGSLYLIEDRFMGQVIWEPENFVDNCSEEDLLVLWDDIFVGTSSGVIVHELFEEGGCGMWAVLNGGAEDIKVLYSAYQEWVLDPVSGERFIGRATGAYHFNITPEAYSLLDFGNYGTTSSSIGLLLSNPDSFNNRSVADLAGASTVFQEHFLTDVGTFVDLGDVYQYDELSGSGTNMTQYNVTIVKNKTLEYFLFEQHVPESLFPAFTANISNFTFEMNSDWNFALKLEDHFGMEEGTFIGVSYDGYNNTGEWINYTIVDGSLSFKSAENFTGEREFLLSAFGEYGTTDSNYFLVTIVEDLNQAPVFQGKIDNMVLNSLTNVTILLEDFFADPDGDSLTYTVENLTDVTYSFEDGEMHLWLKSSFVDHENFVIVASDGSLTARSNAITIFLDNSSGISDDPLQGLDNGTLLVNPGNMSAPDATDNDEGGDSNVGLWIMMIAGVMIVFLVVGAVVYFKVFAKGPVKPPVPNKPIKGGDVKKKEEGVVKPRVKNPVAEIAPTRIADVDNYMKKVDSDKTKPNNY